MRATARLCPLNQGHRVYSKNTLYELSLTIGYCSLRFMCVPPCPVGAHGLRGNLGRVSTTRDTTAIVNARKIQLYRVD